MAALRAPRCAAPLTARARGGQTRQSQPRRAPARCAGLGARLLGSAAALNAERLARKEAAELVGAKVRRFWRFWRARDAPPGRRMSLRERACS